MPASPASLLPGSDSDIFLHVQTRRAGKVKGEANTAGHEDDIIVRTWSWGVSAPTAVGSSQATARRAYKNLSIVKSLDAATTALFSALATNDEVREARLTMRKAGEGQQDYFILTLKSARITAIDLDTDASGGTSERLTFSFSKVEVEYRPQQSSGQRGGSSIFTDEI